MRNELGIQELPPGSPEPRSVPPEGLILGRRESDGWTRRYLLRPSMDGRSVNRIVISETPPLPGEAPPPPPPSQTGLPVVRIQAPPKLMGRPKPVPLTSPKSMGQAFPIGGTLPAGTPRAPSYPGEMTPPPEPLPPSGPPEELPPVCPEGPIQMADGSMVAPEDPITLANLCELIPLLYDAVMIRQMAAAKGKGPRTGPVGLIGMRQGGAMAVPGGMSPFGNASMMGGNGGGGMGFGFAGGGGAQGAVGPRGPVGFGGLMETVTKTDGDYAVAAGAFVAVPGTLISFTSGAGPAMFFVQGTLGNSVSTATDPQSGQIALRIDGVDYPVATRLLHTFVGGVGEFMLPFSVMFPLTLTAGTHTVELLIRGLLAGEFGGSGLGTPFGVCAVTDVPLIVGVTHN